MLTSLLEEMEFAKRVLSTSPPPLTPLMERAVRMRAEGRELFVLAQAMVDYAPPRIFTESLIEGCRLPGLGLHHYAPDHGTPELRAALGRYLVDSFGIDAHPSRQILVTPGANHAGYTALAVLLEPGDEAVLLSPYYFNHQMSVTLLGAKPRLVGARAEQGYLPDVSRILEAWTPRTRALVLVNPNNPTGALYPDDRLRELARALDQDERWRNVWILSDQTYHEIFFTGKRPLSIGSIPGLSQRVVTVGSFSKSLAVAGWRLGFLCGPAAFVDEAVKIQDSSVICATHAAQWALAQTLDHGADCRSYFAEKRNVLARRRDALLAPLLQEERVDVHVPGGACFAFISLPDGVDGRKFAWDLLSTTGVVTVPGIHFGRQWNRHLRLSFGSGTEGALGEAGRRLAAFLAEGF